MKQNNGSAHTASAAARRRLIERFPEDFAALLTEERKARGLPEIAVKVKQPTKAELKAEVERLRAELEKERDVPPIIKANRKYMGKTG